MGCGGSNTGTVINELDFSELARLLFESFLTEEQRALVDDDMRRVREGLIRANPPETQIRGYSIGELVDAIAHLRYEVDSCRGAMSRANRLVSSRQYDLSGSEAHILASLGEMKKFYDERLALARRTLDEKYPLK